MKLSVHYRQFASMFKARTMEFIRDRSTFFWNLLFPVLLVAGFAFAFSGDEDDLFKVGQLGSVPGDFSFATVPYIQFVDYPLEDREAAVELLRRHELDMVLDFSRQTYLINDESPNSIILHRLLEGAMAGVGSDGDDARAPASQVLAQETVTGQAIRYVDWVVPGIIGMNMMFSCMFGVGFVIVRYRKNGVLKRLKATPVSPLNFVTAQAASRLVIVILTSIFVFGVTNIFLKFMMRGNYLTLLLVTVFGILSMISIGLVFASRIKSEELASGLLNLVTLPMLGLSGVFFSLEGAAPIVKTISRIFPLTHFVEGARKVMLEGAGLVEILPNIGYLGLLTAALLLVSSLTFRWE